MERCVHVLLTLLDIIENFALKAKNPPLIRHERAMCAISLTTPPASKNTLMEVDDSGSGRSAQAVGIIRQKDVVLMLARGRVRSPTLALTVSTKVQCDL